MKFGKILRGQAKPEWERFYIPYKQLKGILKRGESSAAVAQQGSSDEVTSLPSSSASSSSPATHFEETLQKGIENTSRFLKAETDKIRAAFQWSRNSRDANLMCCDWARQLARFARLNRLAVRKILKKREKLAGLPRDSYLAHEQTLNLDTVMSPTEPAEIEASILDILRMQGMDMADMKPTLARLSKDSFIKRDLENIEGFIIDMDGVLYHQGNVLPGAFEFVDWLKSTGKKYLFLTNSDNQSPSDLRRKLLGFGLDVHESHFQTAAMATSYYLRLQRPCATAYVIGTKNLEDELRRSGVEITDKNPDYVVVGEARDYNITVIEKAITMVLNGASLIGTGPDAYDKSVIHGRLPSCGALISPISIATGRTPYFCGKPSPITMRAALRRLGLNPERVVMIGDRMDTDILGGMEAEMKTVLVLSGVTTMDMLHRFAYHPTFIVSGLKELWKIMTRAVDEEEEEVLPTESGPLTRAAIIAKISAKL